jgi:RimJ/RimL family protein N-acetyltransferase
MVWASPAYDVEAALRWMRGDFGDVHPFLMIDGDGACVGTCGLNALDELNRRANLGYWVRSDRTGRGHATVATRLVARFGLEEGGLHRLEIIMSTRNERSRRVAERAGAHHEGVARGRLLLHGEHHDADVYSLLPGDLD